MTRVLYPGSFDPVHNGHVDLVTNAAAMFDEVIVAAVGNPQKQSGLFSLDERRALIGDVFAHISTVEAVVHDGLVVDLALGLEVDFIIKGLRTTADFETEMQMAQINKKISGVETVFLAASTTTSFVSSSYVRDIARLGGKVDSLVPGIVADRVRAKLENGV